MDFTHSAYIMTTLPSSVLSAQTAFLPITEIPVYRLKIIHSFGLANLKAIPMKQTALLVLLLGFGYIAPWGCSKKQTSEKKTDQSTHTKPADPKKQVVLFGPVHTIRGAQKA